MKKGMALITVLIIALLLFALVGTFLILGIRARYLNERYSENLIALGLAEAGADLAIWEMNFSGGDFTAAEGWGGVNPKTKIINNFDDAAGNVYGDIFIEVYDAGTSDVTILSTGSLNSVTGPSVIRIIRVLLKEHRLFQFAILGNEDIDISGDAHIDSYDSAAGSYGGTNVGQEGDVVTNYTADPSINIYGSAIVEGDAATGPGGTVDVGGSASLSGGQLDNAEVFTPPVIVPDFLTSLSSGGDLQINNIPNSQVLPTGNYKYDSLALGGKGSLTLGNPVESGTVNIYFCRDDLTGATGIITTGGQSQIIISPFVSANVYFDGNVSIGGQGVVNTSEDPSNLIFFGTDLVDNINLAGVGNFYGAFYAPDSNYFDIYGNSVIFGSIVGNNINMYGSSAVHYDTQLRVDGPLQGFDPYAWQEKY